MYCGEINDEYWKIDYLKEHIIASYGYSSNSKHFLNLLKMMSEFNSS